MYVIGLMSGTSLDGIDGVLVEIEGEGLDLTVKLLRGHTFAYGADLRSQLLAVAGGSAISLETAAQLDDRVAQAFGEVAQTLQQQQPRAQLIGSHGQTVFHRGVSPPALAYSVQWGRGAAIAHHTGIPTVDNFRAADIAMGGEGAPLMPKIDMCLLAAPDHARIVQNLGGIANLTYLPPRQEPHWEDRVVGWDTGPANLLLDLAIAQLTQGQQTYDPQGQWASQGQPCEPLVHQWLQQDFFQQPPPKSTGRELFGSGYLAQCWQAAQPYGLSPADWLATLTELTAASIAQSYRQFLPRLPQEVLLSGGGSHNQYLVSRLQRLLPEVSVTTTAAQGLDVDYKEAIAFAIFAYWRWQGFPGNVPRVTGARQAVCLGDLHYPPRWSKQDENLEAVP